MRCREGGEGGFTLLELLTVMAILAALAALLFPVFAQAKESAKRSACLNNTKEIGTALQIYLGDCDDMTPAVYRTADGISGMEDVFQTMQPYLNNMGVFFCPDRPDSSPLCSFSTFDGLYQAPTNGPNCLGYGYNWGFIPMSGGGLFDSERLSTDSNLLVERGVSATLAETPAALAVWSDTTSGSPFRMSALQAILDPTTLGRDPAIQRNSLLRHGGKFNVVFLDGHSKNVPFKGATVLAQFPGSDITYMGVPRDDALRNMYCLSASAMVNVSALTAGGYGGITNIPCAEAIFLPDQLGLTQWWQD